MEESGEREIEVTVSLTMSKTVKIFVNDYGPDEEGYFQYPDNEELKEEVINQITFPNYLSSVVETAFNEDLGLKAEGMPRFLQNSVNDCKDWFIDDYAVEIG